MIRVAVMFKRNGVAGRWRSPAAKPAALLLAAAVALTPPAAGAVPGSQHQRPPACRGITDYRPGIHVLTDVYSERSPLVRGMDRLICSAADHSVIEIKTWFIGRVDRAIRRLLDHAEMMHRYHHVRVRVLVGGNYWERHRRSMAPTRQLFVGWAQFAACHDACMSRARHGVSHSKWITVSRLRHGGSAVLTTSANLTHQQLARTIQSGILTIGSPPIYRAVHGRFVAYWRCAHGGPCHRTVPVTTPWRGTEDVALFFTPVRRDPITAEVASVDCRRGGTILLATPGFDLPRLRSVLLAKKRQGCRVMSVLQHRENARRLRPFAVRCLTQHDKYLVIDTPRRREVIAGTMDFGHHSRQWNDNVMLRVRVPSVVRAYEQHFLVERSHSRVCHRPRHRT